MKKNEFQDYSKDLKKTKGKHGGIRFLTLESLEAFSKLTGVPASELMAMNDEEE